jgi:hypothetical protein
VTDADYPDAPIGGWAGAVSRVQKDGGYMVLWSRETLDAIDPIFQERSTREGFDLERYWFPEDDLEPDEGGPLEIERPQEIIAERLSRDDRDDRIRVIFGLDDNDPLPAVDGDALEIYFEYLAEYLEFPFEAEHAPKTGRLFEHSRIVKVIAPDNFEDESMIDARRGVLWPARHHRRTIVVPLHELEVEKGKPNRQLLRDYCHWFENYRR